MQNYTKIKPQKAIKQKFDRKRACFQVETSSGQKKNKRTQAVLWSAGRRWFSSTLTSILLCQLMRAASCPASCSPTCPEISPLSVSFYAVVQLWILVHHPEGWSWLWTSRALSSAAITPGGAAGTSLHHVGPSMKQPSAKWAVLLGLLQTSNQIIYWSKSNDLLNYFVQ